MNLVLNCFAVFFKFCIFTQEAAIGMVTDEVGGQRFVDKISPDESESSTFKILMELFENGRIDDAVDETGLTPLCQNVAEYNVNKVRILLTLGADPNSGHLAPITLLFSYFQHVPHNDLNSIPIPEILKLLIAAGAHVDRKDSLGRTVLYHAAAAGSVKCVRLLIAKGADVKTRDNSQQTALIAAASDAPYEVTRLLVINGADIDATNARGVTALYRAACFARADIIILLAAYGANLELRNQRGETALHAATHYGEKDTVASLLAAGANVEAKTDWNYGGVTPIFKAAARGNKEAVKLMIAAGAKVNVRDSNDRSLILAACENEDVVRLLLLAGADMEEALRLAQNTAEVEALFAGFSHETFVYSRSRFWPDIQDFLDCGTKAYLRSTVQNPKEMFKCDKGKEWWQPIHTVKFLLLHNVPLAYALLTAYYPRRKAMQEFPQEPAYGQELTNYKEKLREYEGEVASYEERRGVPFYHDVLKDKFLNRVMKHTHFRHLSWDLTQDIFEEWFERGWDKAIWDLARSFALILRTPTSRRMFEQFADSVIDFFLIPKLHL